MWSGIQYFMLQLLWAAPRYKPVKSKWSLTFLFSDSAIPLKQIWYFSAASGSLFNTSRLLWKSGIQPLYLIVNVLHKLLYTVFTTVHFQWIRNIPICKCDVYTPSRYVFLSFLYMVFYFYFPSSFDFSILYTAHQLAFSCFQSLCIAKMEPWTDADHYESSTIFLSQMTSEFDANIVTAVLKVLATCQRCVKTIQTVYAKVICSFIDCIQRLKQPWQVFDCNVIFVFTIHYHR